MTHTPGPWKYEQWDDHTEGFLNVSIDITKKNGGDFICRIIGGRAKRIDRTIDIDEENARLIAAAPELLEALKAVRSGRVAMKLWVNKNTKCGEESYAHKLSDSALRSFIAGKAIALAGEGE